MTSCFQCSEYQIEDVRLRVLEVYAGWESERWAGRTIMVERFAI